MSCFRFPIRSLTQSEIILDLLFFKSLRLKHYLAIEQLPAPSAELRKRRSIHHRGRDAMPAQSMRLSITACTTFLLFGVAAGSPAAAGGNVYTFTDAAAS